MVVLAANMSRTELEASLATVLPVLGLECLKRLWETAVQELEADRLVQAVWDGTFLTFVVTADVLDIRSASACVAVSRAWAGVLPQPRVHHIARQEMLSFWGGLGFSPALSKAAVTLCAGSKPTPLQQQALRAALGGQDVVWRERRGAGQTFAMLAALTQQLAASETTCCRRNMIRAVILSKSGLHERIRQRCSRLLSRIDAPIRVECLPETSAAQDAMLASPPDVLVGTPSAVLRVLTQLDAWRGPPRSGELQYVFVEHGEGLLPSGFSSPRGQDLGRLMRIAARLPDQRQVCVFGIVSIPPPATQEVYKRLTRNPMLVGEWSLPKWMPQSSRMLTWTESPSAAPQALVTRRTGGNIAVYSRRLPISFTGPQAEASATILAAHEVVRVLQQERGKNCWALVSTEGEQELAPHRHVVRACLDEALGKVEAMVSGAACPSHDAALAWDDLLGVLKQEIQKHPLPGESFSGLPWIDPAHGELATRGALDQDVQPSLQKKSVQSMASMVEGFDQIFANYNGRISLLMDVISRALVHAAGFGPKIVSAYRFFSTAAEQLGRERAFLCSHLEDPVSFREQPHLVRRASEITGARKLLFGVASGHNAVADVVVMGPWNLDIKEHLGCVGGPLLSCEDLHALECAEERIFLDAGDISPPVVREWYRLLTRQIDSIHHRIEQTLVNALTAAH